MQGRVIESEVRYAVSQLLSGTGAEVAGTLGTITPNRQSAVKLAAAPATEAGESRKAG